MRALILIINLLITFPALAINVEDCLKDASSYANHLHPVTPAAECADLIKSNPDKLSLSSPDGKYKVFALKHMLYVENYHEGILVTRELLAGDQTELYEIKSLSLNVVKNRLLVVNESQEGTELLTFKLDFIGNVAPMNMLKADVVNRISSARLLDNANEIAVSLTEENKIRYFSSEADSRYKDQQSKYNPVVLREETLNP